MALRNPLTHDNKVQLLSTQNCPFVGTILFHMYGHGRTKFQLSLSRRVTFGPFLFAERRPSGILRALIQLKQNAPRYVKNYGQMLIGPMAYQALTLA